MSPGHAELPDAEARRRIREDLETTLFVEAAAGTGKTTELVARVVAIIADGKSTLERIVAVTFTEKAAGEMKLRLREDIERARGRAATTAVRSRLDRALGHLEVARIGTIHSFCAELLRERPVEAGIDPLFEVAAEDEADELLARAFDGWLERTLADPPEGVRRVLRRRPRTRFDEGPSGALRRASRTLIEHRDFACQWRRPGFERDQTIDLVMESLHEVASLAGLATRPDDWLAKNLQELERFVIENRSRESVRGRDHDALEAELRDLARSRAVHWRWRGSPHRPYGPDLPRERVITARDALKQELDRLVAAADADLAACLQRELTPVVDAYEAAKRRAGKLDFLDLLLKARDLIRSDASVRASLQERFTHFFVDEYQDTDPLQAEILLLLAADDPAQTLWRQVRPVAGKLFVVGDPKQSIYRFRRADVAIYESTKRQLAGSGAGVVHLTTSFRSVPSLQRAVNAAFAPLMPGATTDQARYVALEPFRPDPPGQPTLVALPVPRPYSDYGAIAPWKIEQSFPGAVAAFVSWLVNESGWRVAEGDARVPVAPRHVCLLMRRFKRFRDDVTRPYVQALEAHRVAHVLVGGHSFHDREEVLAIRNALAAIERPDDELRVFATLRGPLFGFGDDALLAYRHRARRLLPLDPRGEASLDEPTAEVAEALRVLSMLHAKRNRRPIADTVSRLLEAVRAHAGIAIWPTGDQALANCLRVIDIARRFERGGARSFRAFVHYLDTQAEQGTTQDAPLVEEGTEGVRIMTVHRAKGLEFPVVVLADPTCRATRETPTRHVDPARDLWAEPLCGCVPQDLLDASDRELARDREEAVRLAYVAATRARDLLVVPVVGDQPVAGWVEALNPAIYPDPIERREPQTAPACPTFGPDSVLERPTSDPRITADVSVAPGRHRALAGGHDVVWWDPGVLDLERQEAVGLRQQRILEADQSGAAADTGVAAYQAWRDQRAANLERGARPRHGVHPVTMLTGEPARPRDRVELLEVPRECSARPAGRRFGNLVHVLLAVIDPSASPADVLAAARTQGRLLGALDEEIDAAGQTVTAALGHEVFRRAARCADAGALHRETPLVLRLDDDTLAEGVVDLAFRESTGAGGKWTVVDFKTDRELSDRRARYEAQVELYVRAIETATGEPAHGILLLL